MCITPVLSAHQLAIAYTATVDAFADSINGRCLAHDDRVAALEDGDPDIYEGAYDGAMLAIEDGADLHSATTCAENAIRATLIPAGIA